MFMIHFAVSSWSLGGLLQSGLPLLELPQHLKDHDISLLELCHFHLPSTEPDYLQTFRQALQKAEVKLSSLLIDMGDITSPEDEKRSADVQAIREWTDVGATLGAERVRIVAGNQPPTSDVIARSIKHLNELVEYAKHHNVKVSTENWQKTSLEADILLQILENCPDLGLCVDVGNAEQTNDKYATLAKLLPHVTSVHFKARYTPTGKIDAEDVEQCLRLIQQAKFSGVMTLIYESKQNEWEGIGQLRNAIQGLV